MSFQHEVESPKKTKIKNTSEDNRARKDSRLNRPKTRVFNKLAGWQAGRPAAGPEAPGLGGPRPDLKKVLPGPGAPKAKTGHETHVFILRIHNF